MKITFSRDKLTRAREEGRSVVAFGLEDPRWRVSFENVVDNSTSKLMYQSFFCLNAGILDEGEVAALRSMLEAAMGRDAAAREEGIKA